MSSVKTDEAVDASAGSRRHFAALDGLRALAALAVLVCHVTGFTGLTGSSWVGAYTARLGAFGVAIFFVLSGFLLYRPYAVAHLAGTPPPDTGDFYRRRLFRILPAYWVALTALVVFVDHALVRTPKDALQFYLLLQIYDQRTVVAGIGQAWSLCVELSFYLLLPLVASAIATVVRRDGQRGTRSGFESSLRCVAALYVFGFAFRLLIVFVVPEWRIPATSWLPATIDWFAVGMAMAVISADAERGRRLPAPVRALADRPIVSWLLAAEVFWVLVQLDLPRDFAPLSGMQLMGKHTLLGVAAGLLVLPAVFSRRDQNGVLRLLMLRPLQFLGVISYSIFLWHVLWMRETSRWLGIRSLGGRTATVLLATLVATIACSVVSYHVIELPFMRRGRRPPDGSPSGGPTVAAADP